MEEEDGRARDAERHQAMYDYRKMTKDERAQVVEYRQKQGLPWHSPPHWDAASQTCLISAACYEHEPIIGGTPERMSECEHELLAACSEFCKRVHAWCLLPNHYHLLVSTGSIKRFSMELGKVHGRSSHRWNMEDNRTGRHVWDRCFDRVIRNERHFWSTINYVHNNPVHHGYVDKWQDWPWSSAAAFVERVGRDEAIRVWNEYPILDYGKGWDL